MLRGICMVQMLRGICMVQMLRGICMVQMLRGICMVQMLREICTDVVQILRGICMAQMLRGICMVQMLREICMVQMLRGIYMVQMLRGICMAQMQSRKHALDHAECYGSSPTTRARSYRYRICMPWKIYIMKWENIICPLCANLATNTRRISLGWVSCSLFPI